MNRDQVIVTRRLSRQEPRHSGVPHAAQFGSGARGEASDIDIMVDIAPDAPVGVAITHFTADSFPVPVAVANRGSLKPQVRSVAERDRIRAS